MGILSNLVTKMIKPLSTNQTWKEFLNALVSTADDRLLYTLRVNESSALAKWVVPKSKLSHTSGNYYSLIFKQGWPNGEYTIQNTNYWEVLGAGHITAFTKTADTLYEIFRYLGAAEPAFQAPLILTWNGKSADMVDLYYNGIQVKSYDNPKDMCIRLPFDTMSFYLFNLGLILKKKQQNTLRIVPQEDSHVEYTFTVTFARQSDGNNHFGKFFYSTVRMIPYAEDYYTVIGDKIYIGDTATGSHYEVIGQSGGRVFVSDPGNNIPTGSVTITVQRWFGGYLPAASFDKLESYDEEVNEMINSSVPFNALAKNQNYVCSISETFIELLSIASYTPNVLDTNIGIVNVMGNDEFTITKDVSATWLHIKDVNGVEITHYIGAIPLYVSVDLNSTEQVRETNVMLTTVHSGILGFTVRQLGESFDVHWNNVGTQQNPIIWDSPSDAALLATVVTRIAWKIHIADAYMIYPRNSWYHINLTAFSPWYTKGVNRDLLYQTQATGTGIIEFLSGLQLFEDDVDNGEAYYTPTDSTSNGQVFNRVIEMYGESQESNSNKNYVQIRKPVGAWFSVIFYWNDSEYTGSSIVDFDDTIRQSATQIRPAISGASYKGNVSYVYIPTNLRPSIYPAFTGSILSNCASWKAQLVNMNDSSEVVAVPGAGNRQTYVKLSLPLNSTDNDKTWQFQFLLGDFIYAYFQISQPAQTIQEALNLLDCDQNPIGLSAPRTQITNAATTAVFFSAYWYRNTTIGLYIMARWSNDGDKMYVKLIKNIQAQPGGAQHNNIIGFLYNTDAINVDIYKNGVSPIQINIVWEDGNFTSSEITQDSTMPTWDGWISMMNTRVHKQYSATLI